MKTLLTKCVLLGASFTLLVSDRLAQAQTPPPGGGLEMYVKKHTYQSGEVVKFKLRKYAGVDDMPANLQDSYYLIEKNMGDHWREFYTSRKNPFGSSLPLETDKVWTWDQKDNETTHRALPGQWRLRFFAPKGNVRSPMEVRFAIEDSDSQAKPAQKKGPHTKASPGKNSPAKGAPKKTSRAAGSQTASRF